MTVDLYDSEVAEAQKVLQALQLRQHTSVSLESFRQEILERFANVGLRVEVKVWTVKGGAFAFDVEIVDRIEPIVFDPERMAHEVQHDLLGIDRPGTVTMDGSVKDPRRVF